MKWVSTSALVSRTLGTWQRCWFVGCGEMGWANNGILHLRTYTSCYATVLSLALPHAHTHTRHATSALLYILSHFHTHVLLRYCMLTCTSTRRHTHTHVMLQVRYCTFSRTSTLMSCYATVLSLALPRAHTHTSCYKCATVHSLALPHSCLATLLYFLLHFHTRTHTHVMLQVRYCTFSRASTLMSFYTTVLSLAVPHAHTHTRHATCALLYIFSRFSTHVMLRYCTCSCTSTRTHTSCYKCATVHSLALNVMLCYCTFTRTHTHTRHATSALLYILSRFHTPAVPRYCTLSGAFAHMSCYATVRFVCASTIMACYFTLRSLPSTLMSCYAMYTLSCTCAHLSCYATVRSVAHRHAHTRHAISALLYILLRFHAHVMLRYCTFSCAFTLMSCYATFFAIPHTCHATLLYAFCLLHSTCSCHATLLHALFNLHTHVMLRYCTFSCTSTRIHKHTHTHHATSALPYILSRFHPHVMRLYAPCLPHSCHATFFRSLALPHTCHATLLLVLLHFQAHVMLRYCTFFCVSTHMSCYTTVRALVKTGKSRVSGTKVIDRIWFGWKVIPRCLKTKNDKVINPRLWLVELLACATWQARRL